MLLALLTFHVADAADLDRPRREAWWNRGDTIDGFTIGSVAVPTGALKTDGTFTHRLTMLGMDGFTTVHACDGMVMEVEWLTLAPMTRVEARALLGAIIALHEAGGWVAAPVPPDRVDIDTRSTLTLSHEGTPWIRDSASLCSGGSCMVTFQTGLSKMCHSPAW